MPPLEANTVLLQERSLAYRAALAHPDEHDPYWHPIDQRDSLARVTAATHIVTGWYDIFLSEALADYVVLCAAGQTPSLTIGPWSHADSEVGGEGLRQGLAWFDAHLKGERAALRQHPVRLYLMGDQSWRELDQWPPASHAQCYFLHADGHLSSQAAVDSPPDRYRYNPADPTPAVGGAMLSSAAGPKDQRRLEMRRDVLCYTPAPLNDPSALRHVWWLPSKPFTMMLPIHRQ